MSEEAQAESQAAELVRRIGHGDPEAETEVARAYGPGLDLVLRRLGCDPALAEDLRQDTLSLALEKLRVGAIDDPAKLAPFLRSTARNLFLGRIRRSQRRQAKLEQEPTAGLAPPEAGPMERLLRRERAGIVRRLLAELSTDRDREVLYRFYLAEDERAEIRRDLGLTALQFNRVLHRSRQRFKELWRELVQQSTGEA